MIDYIKINKKSWNDRVDTHVASAFYDIDSFKAGKSSLNPIEVEMLGNIQDKTLLHLQCHFGLDTLSLARLGARCTGVDFSDKAISQAKDLASEHHPETDFICSDIYSLPSVNQGKKYNIAFTSYGTIGWLPDINKWANVVSDMLDEDGVFVMVDFHPLIWMMDDEMERIKYRYFNSEPIVETEGSYTENSDHLGSQTVGWNHGLAEIIQSLLQQGLELQHFQEHDFSPYDCFPDMVEEEEGVYRHKVHGNLIPYIYSLKLKKRKTSNK